MSHDSSDAVTYRSQDRIATITITRPDGMNRLDDAIVEGLHHSWRRFMASEEDRVAGTLRSAGPRAQPEERRERSGCKIEGGREEELHGRSSAFSARAGRQPLRFASFAAYDPQIAGI